MAETATKVRETAPKKGEELLVIDDLHAGVEGREEILKGITLTIKRGEVHAIMGPNGSGKSTLSYVLMGRPGYKVTKGTVLLKGEDVLGLTPDERAKRGLFLAFQYPQEIPGISVVNFLRAARNAAKSEEMAPLAFHKFLKEKMALLGIPDDMVRRYVNQGFSGGEKKRNEILQMAVLEPEMAVLDETDSGLDIDALRAVAEGIDDGRDREDGRAADHPLPADPELHHARRRPRDRSTAASCATAGRNWRPSWSRRGTIRSGRRRGPRRPTTAGRCRDNDARSRRSSARISRSSSGGCTATSR